MLGCIIQARMGSSRLKGKVMMKIDEKNSLLSFLLNQLRNSKFLKNIVIATTDLPEDDIIVNHVKNLNTKVFRGNANNVLDRYYQCAKTFSFSSIVRLSADNPLIDPTIIDEIIKKFSEKSYDYVSNTQPLTFPQGTEVEIFSFSVLKLAWERASKISEKEHVTPFIYSHKNEFRIYNVQNSENLSNFRWTVDRETDLTLVHKIIQKIPKRPILMNDILKLLKDESELIDINRNHLKDEGYIKSLRDDQ